MLGSDRTLLRLQPWSSHPGRSVEHFGVGFDLSADGMNVMTQLCRCVARHPPFCTQAFLAEERKTVASSCESLRAGNLGRRRCNCGFLVHEEEDVTTLWIPERGRRIEATLFQRKNDLKTFLYNLCFLI